MIRLVALVVVVAFVSSCAGTFHARAVQQTAGGAVLLASGVGGAVGTIGGAVVVGSLPEPPQSSVVGIVAGGVVAVGFIAIGAALLAAGSDGLDTYGPQDTEAISAAVERESLVDDPRFVQCLRSKLCPDGGDRCASDYQREFASTADRAAWFARKGC